jgi:CRP-like cAMP-binding protein
MKKMFVVENNLNRHMLRETMPIFETGSSSYIDSKQADPLSVLFTQHKIFKKYKKKQVIYSEGTLPSYIFLIKKGFVKTFKCNGEGKQLITGIYGEGEYIGYVALFENTEYKDMAVAVEYAELAMAPKDVFEQMMKSDWEMARTFIKLLAKGLSDKEQLLLGLAYNSLRKKVAEALILLSHKYKDAISISRNNLAAIAGTATESLIRTLGEFRQEKLIEISEGYITILNEAKLRMLS